eukprot:11278547-Karenia_brevis.AAC.1
MESNHAIFVKELQQGFASLQQSLDSLERIGNVVSFYDNLCNLRHEAEGLCNGCIARFHRSHDMQTAFSTVL